HTGSRRRNRLWGCALLSGSRARRSLVSRRYGPCVLNLWWHTSFCGCDADAVWTTRRVVSSGTERTRVGGQRYLRHYAGVAQITQIAKSRTGLICVICVICG